MIEANTIDKSSIAFVRNYLNDMLREKDANKRTELLHHYLKVYKSTLIDQRALDIGTVIDLNLYEPEKSEASEESEGSEELLSDLNEEVSRIHANANPDSHPNFGRRYTSANLANSASNSTNNSNRSSNYIGNLNGPFNTATSSRGRPDSKEKGAPTNKSDPKHILSSKKRHFKKSNNSKDACKLCSKRRSCDSNNTTNPQNNNPSTSRSGTCINENNLNVRYNKENSSKDNLVKKEPSQFRANKRKRSAPSSIPAPHEPKIRATNSDKESEGKPFQIIEQLDRFPITTRIFTKFYEDQVGDKESKDPGKMQRKMRYVTQELNKLNKCGGNTFAVKEVKAHWKVIMGLMGSFSEDSVENIDESNTNLNGRSTSTNKNKQKMNREYRHRLNISDYVPRTHYLEEPDTQIYKNVNYFIHGARRGGTKFYRDQPQSP